MSFQEHHLLQILRRFDHQHLPLDLFISQYFRAHTSLGAKDRRFISETLYGMVRWKGLLDHLAESVSWEQRYAIYKAFQPSQYLAVNSMPLHTRLSFPPTLFNLILKNYGEEKTIQICQATNTQAPITVRANPLKTTREHLLSLWKDKYEVVACEYSPLGIQFKKRQPFFEMEEFKQGFFEVQDEASQLVAELVTVEPGAHVLDYCAGSGGKSLAFAHKMEGKGQLYLHDIRPIALEQAKKRFKRAGIQNVQFLIPDHPQLNKIQGKIDFVVIDAPCSGTGTLRRNPDMKWKFSKEMLMRLLEEQRAIFEKGLSYVKPGGKVLYATCSLLKEENEMQLDYFLKHYPLKLIEKPFCSIPTVNGMDGFFAAVLQVMPSLKDPQ